MYYALVSAAVMMFGFQFLLNQKYEEKYGNGAAASAFFIIISNAVGFVVLAAVNKFRFEYTLFTVIMALITALNSLLFNICSLKALGKINLSLYSIFSMLGGMTLPFLIGIIFFDESMTVNKTVCFILISCALLLTVKSGERGEKIYYLGVFVFNGMSGVLSKIFQSLEFQKTSAAGYSVWTAALTVLLAFLMLLFVKEKRLPLEWRSAILGGSCGAISKIANLFLLIALAHLPASVQYPMVTGGVMAVSMLISFFTSKKPDMREIGALILSFAGIIILII